MVFKTLHLLCHAGVEIHYSEHWPTCERAAARQQEGGEESTNPAPLLG